METNYTINSIFHIAKADFLQRIRSYYFLITLAVCVFIIYSFVPAIDAGYRIVSLGNYRGFYNSAWIGSMVAMCVPFFTLLGFYVINNAVKRDIDTGVGQIIATTRINRIQYLSGKLLSNFAVLLLMLTIIAFMTVVMFLLRGETSKLELGKLLLPLFILTVPAMFILASLALFFDSIKILSRGGINIAYFFLWIFIVSSALWSPYTDVFGVNTCLNEITKSVSASHPDWNGQSGTGILISGSQASCKVFIWEGMKWTPEIFLQRIFWMCAAFSLVLLASLQFNSFDTVETKAKRRRTWWFMKGQTVLPEHDIAPMRIRYRDLPVAKARFSFIKLSVAELRLMLKGRAMLWLLLTAGLWIASVFTPLNIAYKYFLPLLWFLQTLILSTLGSRELANRCNEYIFSAASPLQRQLPATFSAAVILMLTLAIPVLLRVFFSGNFYGVYAILTGALFIPAFAIASGILTGGSKLFEVTFTVIVYGILNGVPFFDFTGAIKESHETGIAHYLLAITILLVILALTGRKYQIRNAA